VDGLRKAPARVEDPGYATALQSWS